MYSLACCVPKAAAHLKAPHGVWFLVLDDDLDAGARREPLFRSSIGQWLVAAVLTEDAVKLEL